MGSLRVLDYWGVSAYLSKFFPASVFETDGDAANGFAHKTRIPGPRLPARYAAWPGSATRDLDPSEAVGYSMATIGRLWRRLSPGGSASIINCHVQAGIEPARPTAHASFAPPGSARAQLPPSFEAVPP